MPEIDAERVVELFGHGPDAVLVCDDKLHCRFATGGLITILGYRPEELVGRPLVDLVDPTDMATALDYLARLPHEDFAGRAAARIRLLDAHAHPRATDVLAANDSDGTAVFVIRDAQEAAENERSIQRVARFESLLNRVVSSFVGARAHELDDVLHRILTDIGTFLEADLGYVARIDVTSGRGTLEQVWRAGGSATETADYPRWALPIDDDLRTRVATLTPLARPDAADRGLDPILGAAARSVLQIPFMVHDRPAGVLGFLTTDEPAEWHQDDITVLRVVASTVGQVLGRRDAEARSARMYSQMRAAFEDAPVALALLDPSGTVQQANPALQRMLGLGPEITGSSFAQLVHPDDLDTALAGWRSLLRGGGEDAVTSVEFRLRAEVGWLWIRAEVRAVRDDTGTLQYCVARVESIDERKRAQHALARSEARFARLVENLPDAVCRIDRDRKVLFANSAALDLWQRIGLNGDHRNVLSGPFGRKVHDALRRTFETGHSQTVDLDLYTPDERTILQAVLVPEWDDSGVEQVLAVIRDMTESRTTADELAYRASHDLLTDLANRSCFLDGLTAAMEQLRHPAGAGEPRRIAVLFFDLDRFKQVNDSLGHGVGDALLKTVAERLRRAVRPRDLLARLGGDEFTVLIPDVDERTALAAAHRLIEVLLEPIRVAEQEFIMGASVGVVVTDDPLLTPADVLRRADTAMYHAKESGRARVALFDDWMLAQVEQRLELDQRLRTVIDRGELRVYFQPEVRLVDGRVIGAEALVRWQHPERGLLAAGEFVQHAEETGVIGPIGIWVLEQACDWAVRWIEQLGDEEFILRVNLSARQLTEPAFVSRLAAVLSITGLHPSRLCLEITETALMTNAEEAVEALALIDRLGVSIAVDDFGTGYSSLAYLKRLPVDVVKVDRSFVGGLPDDSEDTAIVTTIVKLAESLGITPTAEGVESDLQRQMLVDLGVDRGQGFLFSRPIPPEEFEQRYVDETDGAGFAISAVGGLTVGGLAGTAPDLASSGGRTRSRLA